MSVNYFNSAGTDLDNLFYVNNGNAGAIGFVEASGQDLGNRYTNASTLGYSVGFVNSAGTDLGYLRGNAVPPSISNYWANNTSYTNSNDFNDHYRDLGDQGSEYESTSHFRQSVGYVNAGCNCSGTGDLIWQLAISVIAGSSHSVSGTFYYWGNTTENKNIEKASVLKSATQSATFSLNAGAESGWLWIYNAVGGTGPWRNFTYYVTGGWDDTASVNTNVSFGLRVYQRVYSSVGDAGWRHNDVWFG